MNTTRPLFRDVTMRQAVAYAIDRTALMRLGGLNGGGPNDQILAPGLPGYKPVTLFPDTPNVKKARALMNGRTAKAVLYTSTDAIYVAASELIRQSLERDRHRRRGEAVHVRRDGQQGGDEG